MPSVEQLFGKDRREPESEETAIYIIWLVQNATAYLGETTLGIIED
jgi:hypothetical protein